MIRVAEVEGRSSTRQQVTVCMSSVGVVFIYGWLVAAEPGTTLGTRLSPELNTR